MKKQELLQIIGGINITGAFLNYLVKGINAFMDLGRSLGTSIRRAIGGNLCPVA